MALQKVGLAHAQSRLRFQGRIALRLLYTSSLGTLRVSIKNGDEDGARAVLVEKATVKEALASNAAKASANAMLVQKLAPIIAAKQQQLPTPPSEPSKKKAAMMWPPPPTFPSTSPPASSPPPPSYANSSAGAAEKAAAAAAAAAAAIARASSAPPAPSSSPSPPTPSFNSEPVYANPFPAQPAPGWDASSWAVAGAESSGATWPMPKWQQSLEEARARLQAERPSGNNSWRSSGPGVWVWVWICIYARVHEIMSEAGSASHVLAGCACPCSSGHGIGWCWLQEIKEGKNVEHVPL
eukprot:scaffold109609_cov18-Tisochrysis_lutea.AAC.1